ncbi:MAG: BCAM0308 family protein [Geobacteraceae bacterium]|nr:BCAM0308 family protein [Geobacteraceae bacterium]
MTRGPRKIGFEEMGKMAERSTDVYLPKGGSREVTLCSKCNAFYWNKRWSTDAAALTKAQAEAGTAKAVCPACQRMHDDNPAGVLSLSGDYLLQHENDILNMIKHVEAVTRAKNPLARIMEINQENKVLTISTTDAKLAQKLGRELFKAHKGELHFLWSQADSFVRVNWTR